MAALARKLGTGPHHVLKVAQKFGLQFMSFDAHDDPQSPVARLCTLFGGSRKSLADAIGVSPAVITRWGKPAGKQKGGHHGNAGRVPPEYNIRVLNAALVNGVDFEAVNACLDKVCPGCGQPLPMGE